MFALKSVLIINQKQLRRKFLRIGTIDGEMFGYLVKYEKWASLSLSLSVQAQHTLTQDVFLFHNGLC